MRRFVFVALLSSACASSARLPPPGDVPSGPSSGCGKAAQTGVTVGAMIVVDGQDRSYVLSVPEGYDPDTPLPLVFGWHGNRWNGKSFRDSSIVEPEAAGGAIFVYPDGLDSSIGGSGWDLDLDSPDIALFDALVADLGSRYCVDQSRIYTFGRSYGGYFTNTLACARGSWLAATASMVGGGPPSDCDGPISAWITHNQDDPTVTIDQGRHTRDHYLALNQCEAASSPVDPAPCVEHRCEGGKRVVWCENPTGGHQPAGYASAAIWRFFSSVGPRP